MEKKKLSYDEKTNSYIISSNTASHDEKTNSYTVRGDGGITLRSSDKEAIIMTRPIRHTNAHSTAEVLRREYPHIHAQVAVDNRLNAVIVESTPQDMAQIEKILGIEVQPIPDALRTQLNLGESGILVTDILKDSPAQKAGIERWDIILEFQGNPIDSAKTLQRRLYRTPPEEEVELLILRKGQQKKIKTKIEALQNESKRPTGLVPTQFRISNFPNPMTASTWITYELPEEAHLTLDIYNVKGELIRKIDLGKKKPGYYTTQANAAYWNGTDDAGKSIPNGIYFCTVRAGKDKATTKILVSR